MNIELENNDLKIMVRSKGAELRLLKEKKDGTDYLWNGDPSWWKYCSPILFPIIGKVKNGKYKVDGKVYELPQHGLGRISEFELVNKTTDSVSFKLRYSDETLKVYPYKFELTVSYVLTGRSVNVTWRVDNLDDREIIFSIGAHPALRCPIVEGESFSDCYLDFHGEEHCENMKTDADVLFLYEREKDLDSDKMNLSYDIFKEGVHVFDNLKTGSITLRSTKSKKAITLSAPSYPYMGIWSPEKGGAPFVCVEPWYGHADYADFDGDFKDKEGVIALEKGKSFKTGYTLTIE